MATPDSAVRLKLRKEVFIRGAGFALAAVTLGAALLAGSILRDPARARSAPAPEAAAEAGKDQTRVARETRRIAATQALPVAPAGESPAIVEAEPSGAAPLGEWKDQEFTFVEAVDGGTLRAGDITIRLTGLELPRPDQVCRTLDDRLEQCVARAATQLELMTRSRTLACRYRMTTSSEAVGSCRIGSHDLAERLIRTGYARAAGAVVANAGGIDAAR